MTEIIDSKEFNERYARLSKGKTGTSANKVTAAIIQYANAAGHMAWRNNTMGILDHTAMAVAIIAALSKLLTGRFLPNDKLRPASKKVLGEIAKGTIPKIQVVRRLIKTCYKKSHELKGASDVFILSKKGQFVAVEVKVGKDKMRPEQEWFRKDIEKRNGLFIEARSFDSFMEQWIAYGIR